MKIFKLVNKYFVNHVMRIIALIMLIVITWAISIVYPYLIGKYIDMLSNRSLINNSRIYTFTKILLILAIIEIISSYINNMNKTKLRTLVNFELNYFILEHVKKLPLSFFHGLDASYLNQRINIDCNIIIGFILDNFINIITNVITFIAALIFLFKIDIKITYILSIIIPLYIILYLVLKKPLYKTNMKYKEQQSNFFSNMNEQLSNVKLIKLHSWFEILADKLKSSFKLLYESGIQYSKWSFIFSSMDLATSRVTSIILFFYGGFEILNNKMTIGNFTMINTYYLMILGCISYMLSFGKSYQDALTSYDRINNILKIEQEPNGKSIIHQLDNIELKDITFSYKEKKNIIEQFSYKFNKGYIYCVIGRNGSGKSTLIDLILGLLKDYDGEIKYNNNDIKDLNMYELRKKIISVTEQEPKLLNDTIYNNITYGINHTEIKKNEKLVKNLNLYDYIMTLPQKFDTIIEENCSNISGGEKQKISLIRMLVKNADLLILDEPTSALDKESIKNLKKILNSIKKKKIIILITHCTEFFDISDFVINFDEKGIQEKNISQYST